MHDTPKEQQESVNNTEKVVLTLGSLTGLLALYSEFYLQADREHVVTFFKHAHEILQNPDLSFKITALMTGQGSDLFLPISVFFSVYTLLTIEQLAEQKIGKTKKEDALTKEQTLFISMIGTTVLVLAEIFIEALASVREMGALSNGELLDLIAFSPMLISMLLYFGRQILKEKQTNTSQTALFMNDQPRDKFED